MAGGGSDLEQNNGCDAAGTETGPGGHPWTPMLAQDQHSAPSPARRVKT